MAERTIGGRYRLRGRLGAGGMAAVWKAEDLELGRGVAVKLLAPDADRARFEREARLLAGVTHPNVVRLFDSGEDAGVPFMVLELLPGGSLRDLLVSDRWLPDEDAARIAAEIAAGLAAAHAQGLVHRDLKPGNVLFDGEGRAKIADFGIARAAGAGTLTDPGTVLGTAAYISPEQAAGEPATAASDVYSFGVILYRLLAGRLPFESASAAELVHLHQAEPPPPISALRGDAPPDLAALALAAMAKQPSERPPHGAALVEALRVAASTAAGDALAGEVTAVLEPRRRSRAPQAAAVFVALLLLGGGGVALALVAWSEDGGTSGPTIGDLPVGSPTGGRVTPASPPPPPATSATTEGETTVATPTQSIPTVEPTTTIEPIPTVDTQITTPTEPPPAPPPPTEPPPLPTEPATTARP